jgi:ketosteroid isomerase-like protein
MNRRVVVLALGLMALLGVVTCGTQATDGPTEADRATIRDAVQAQLAAAKAGDSAAWAAWFTDDAIVLRPHGEAVEGRSAIQTWLAALPPISEFRAEVLEIEGQRELLVSRSAYSLAMTLPNAIMFRDEGKGIQVYRRQADGTWKVWREIYNSDLPLPAPEASATSTR